MREVHWERIPLVAHLPSARQWLTEQVNLGLADNTIDAYGRDLQDYISFCTDRDIGPESATRADIALYIRDLYERPASQRPQNRSSSTRTGLAPASMRRRLTSVRLYYDFLVEEAIRTTNPVSRGRPHKQRGLIPSEHRLPWIPTEAQWAALLQAARLEPLRNRVMFALAYDCGLRREELCALHINDIDPAHRQITIRPDITKNKRQREVRYQAETSLLYVTYLHHRRKLSHAPGPLFLSESPRNYAEAISKWTWSKVIRRIAARAGVPNFTPHTLRHLCLTDLARAGWDIHDIAMFAGHRSLETTTLYIHKSGRDIAEKLEQIRASIHAQRAKDMAEVLQ
jgi:integrase/recombinase XerD